MNTIQLKLVLLVLLNFYLTGIMAQYETQEANNTASVAQSKTRLQNMKKAKKLQKLNSFLYKIEKPFKNHKKHKEVFIETEYGTVRTLWYGFDNPEIVPVLFDLHGGGFILGQADMDEAMNLVFQKQTGCKVISIDYAKAPDHPYPVAVNQIYAVVKHVYENADKYSIDISRMAIGGHSAGANLSTVTCLKAKQEGKFQFVCQLLDYPPLDIATNPYDKLQPKGCIPPKMAIMFNDGYVDSTQAKDIFVSPVFATIDELTGLPPAIFILPGHDSLHDEGIKYSNMLKDAGVEMERYEYPDSKHGFTYYKSDNSTDAIGKMANFLNKYLK